MIRGSPPPLRGTPKCNIKRLDFHRITPATAGNTVSISCWYPRTRDHPRHCGEHWRYTSQMSFVAGSPPPLRGTLPCLLLGEQGRRITPATAGNTRKRLNGDWTPEDHPRHCGEHIQQSIHCLCRLGSPPPLRGTPIFFSL